MILLNQNFYLYCAKFLIVQYGYDLSCASMLIVAASFLHFSSFAFVRPVSGIARPGLLVFVMCASKLVCCKSDALTEYESEMMYSRGALNRTR